MILLPRKPFASDFFFRAVPDYPDNLNDFFYCLRLWLRTSWRNRPRFAQCTVCGQGEWVTGENMFTCSEGCADEYLMADGKPFV